MWARSERDLISVLGLLDLNLASIRTLFRQLLARDTGAAAVKPVICVCEAESIAPAGCCGRVAVSLRHTYTRLLPVAFI